MSYSPAWQRLSDAIESVMAGAGRSREAAQADICQAIADRTVNIRGKLRRHTTRPIAWNNVLEGKHFDIPTEIKPADLDWERSRPVKPWAVHYEVFRVPGHWELEWIELSRTDVMNVLCTPDRPSAPSEPTLKKTGTKGRSQPTRERAKAAIDELYPQGVPSQAALPNKKLCRRIGEKLKERGLPHVSDDTILRAAGRCK
jgi:hypothetical protein